MPTYGEPVIIPFSPGPFVFHAGANPTANAKVLRILLECLINIDRVFLRAYPNTPPLYKSGVVYGRTDEWDAIPSLYGKKYGDCKSLSACLIAQYRESGIEARPVFRFNSNPDGSTDYHILVLRDGAFEDPSKVCGMGKNEFSYFGGGRRK